MKLKWTTSELSETLLLIQAVAWGIILLFPGDTFAVPNQVSFMSKYAPDTVWGAILLLFSVPLFIFRGYGYRRLRKLGHASLWTFWLGIVALTLYRTITSPNGLTPPSFLIIIPFLTIAFLHGIIYAGLEREI